MHAGLSASLIRMHQLIFSRGSRVPFGEGGGCKFQNFSYCWGFLLVYPKIRPEILFISDRNYSASATNPYNANMQIDSYLMILKTFIVIWIVVDEENFILWVRIQLLLEYWGFEPFNSRRITMASSWILSFPSFHWIHLIFHPAHRTRRRYSFVRRFFQYTIFIRFNYAPSLLPFHVPIVQIVELYFNALYRQKKKTLDSKNVRINIWHSNICILVLLKPTRGTSFCFTLRSRGGIRNGERKIFPIEGENFFLPQN